VHFFALNYYDGIIAKNILVYCILYISYNFNCGVVSLFIFLEKTKQKIASVLESLCFQGRSQRQGTLCVINGLIAYA